MIEVCRKVILSMNRYIALQKVVEVGSFTKAAELLGYTQPALGQMIASLERELNIKLLYRTGLPDAGGRAYFPSHSKIGIAISCDAGDCQIFPADGFDFDRREREMAGIRNIVTDKDLTRDGKWKYNWTERKQQE